MLHVYSEPNVLDRSWKDLMKNAASAQAVSKLQKYSINNFEKLWIQMFQEKNYGSLLCYFSFMFFLKPALGLEF